MRLTGLSKLVSFFLFSNSSSSSSSSSSSLPVPLVGSDTSSTGRYKNNYPPFIFFCFFFIIVVVFVFSTASSSPCRSVAVMICHGSAWGRPASRDQNAADAAREGQQVRPLKCLSLCGGKGAAGGGAVTVKIKVSMGAFRAHRHERCRVRRAKRTPRLQSERVVSSCRVADENQVFP